MAKTEGADDPLEIAITTLKDGKVSGPLRVSIVLSPAPIRGTLYYSSYGSPSAGNLAAVMRLQLGDVVTPFVAPLGTCAGCHGASANGSTVLLANSGSGEVYRLPPDGEPVDAPSASLVSGAEYAAVDPSGNVYVAGSTAAGLGPPRRTPGPVNASLLSVPDGSAQPGLDLLPAPSGGLPAAALMPAFSPDGTALAFNDATDSPGHVLAVVAFTCPTAARSSTRATIRTCCPTARGNTTGSSSTPSATTATRAWYAASGAPRSTQRTARQVTLHTPRSSCRGKRWVRQTCGP